MMNHLVFHIANAQAAAYGVVVSNRTADGVAAFGRMRSSSPRPLGRRVFKRTP